MEREVLKILGGWRFQPSVMLVTLLWHYKPHGGRPPYSALF